MKGNEQIQNAGDNSQQLQANTINITNVVGIDEKRAREIFNEMYAIARRDFTQDAYECANDRVAKFEESLMPKMIQIEGALEAFADPSFQFLLTEAHKTAASTEREMDYDLLSELLVHRIQNGETRKTRAGIKRAVEIVDQVDDDALCGLTVAHAVVKFLPVANSVLAGLDILDEMFEKMIYMPLPSGREWLDHLDMLDAIRVSPFGTLKKTEQYYSERLNGFACVGICREADVYSKALKILAGANLSDIWLQDNELMNGYARLPVANQKDIHKKSFILQLNVNGQEITEPIDLSVQQREALEKVCNLYDGSDTLKNEMTKKFMEEWKKRKSLKVLQEWWDNIPVSFDVTSVGTVLAHANAQRCDHTIPSLT